MRHPTYLDALEAAQTLGFTHVQDASSRHSPDLEEDELRPLPIQQYIDLQAWPRALRTADGRVPTNAEIEAGMGGEAEYVLTDATITTRVGEPLALLSREA